MPKTNVQSATASARVATSIADSSSCGAPTAERASRQCGAWGETMANLEKPKLAMARAAAPIFSGLRGETRMISMQSRRPGWVLSVGKRRL